jgi:hypothetical protein
MGGYDATAFATNLGQGGPVAMTFGKIGGDTDLYYTTYAGGDGGQIRRISYVGGTRASNAVAKTVGYNYGPQDKRFESGGGKSTDPDDSLGHAWDFGGVAAARVPIAARTYGTLFRAPHTLPLGRLKPLAKRRNPPSALQGSAL